MIDALPRAGPAVLIDSLDNGGHAVQEADSGSEAYTHQWLRAHAQARSRTQQDEKKPRCNQAPWRCIVRPEGREAMGSTIGGRGERGSSLYEVHASGCMSQNALRPGPRAVHIKGGDLT